MRVRRKRKSFYIDKIGRKGQDERSPGAICEMQFEKWEWLSHGKKSIWTFSLERIAVWGTHGRKTFSILEAVRGDLAVLAEHSQRARRNDLRWAG